MEPISLILAALAAGAVAAAKDTAGTAVKDSYEGLKALIKKRFADKGKEDDSDIVDKHEKKPDSKAVKALLEEELVEAGLDKLKEDDEIIKAAQEIMKKEDPEGFEKGVYVTVAGDVFGVVGDNEGTVNINSVNKGK